MSKHFESLLELIANNFKKDVSKMIIYTGVGAWILSSLAQIGIILFSKKFSDEQKSFILPQELMDMGTNIALFLAFTIVAKQTVTKLFKTGKWAPVSVKKYLAENKELFKDKIGKINFDLGEHLETNNPELFDKYETCKNFHTTLATVGASIIASNIATPIIRNNTAALAQKKFVNYKNTQYQPYSGDMRI